MKIITTLYSPFLKCFVSIERNLTIPSQVSTVRKITLVSEEKYLELTESHLFSTNSMSSTRELQAFGITMKYVDPSKDTFSFDDKTYNVPKVVLDGEQVGREMFSWKYRGFHTNLSLILQALKSGYLEVRTIVVPRTEQDNDDEF